MDGVKDEDEFGSGVRAYAVAFADRQRQCGIYNPHR